MSYLKYINKAYDHEATIRLVRYVLNHDVTQMIGVYVPYDDRYNIEENVKGVSEFLLWGSNCNRRYVKRCISHYVICFREKHHWLEQREIMIKIQQYFANYSLPMFAVYHASNDNHNIHILISEYDTSLESSLRNYGGLERLCIELGRTTGEYLQPLYGNFDS